MVGQFSLRVTLPAVLVSCVVLFAGAVDKTVSCGAMSIRTFHLTPGAPDGGDGSAAKPFGTFDEARSAVREAVKNTSQAGTIEVVVADGTWFVPKTLVFDKTDSGTREHPVVWRAATKGGARLTGGVPVPPLRKLTSDDPAWTRIPEVARGHVEVADLKAAGITDYGVVNAAGVGPGHAAMELVWDGRLQTLAEWPNGGFTGIASVPDLGKDANGKPIRGDSFTYKDNRVSTWVNEPEPYGNGFFCYNWAAARVAFAKIDPATKTITHRGKGSNYGYSKNGFWRGINLLCELDSPGEYYIDRGTGRFYFWPTTPKTDPDAALTVTVDLLSAKQLSHVTFSGFVFENCRGKTLGFAQGEDVRVEACVVRNAGVRGVSFDRMRDSRLVGCDVAWCGSGGVAAFGGTPGTLEHVNTVIENCHIHHYSVSQFTYSGAVNFGGCGITVTRCTIHDGPHTALIFGGREHTISRNEIHSVCVESGEMGAIYCGRDWTLCGNLIEGNWIHDIYSPRSQPNRAIMLDDGAAGILMFGNRFERVGEGVSLSAIGNRLENNLFVSNGTPVSVWQKWDKPKCYKPSHYTHQTLLNAFYALKVHDEPWKSKYPYLALIDDAIKTGKMRAAETRSTIRCNLLMGCPEKWISDYRGKYAVTEDTWDVADNVRDGVEPVGWRSLPELSEIGAYATPSRATWPVDHPVTRKYAR